MHGVATTTSISLFICLYIIYPHPLSPLSLYLSLSLYFSLFVTTFIPRCCPTPYRNRRCVWLYLCLLCLRSHAAHPTLTPFMPVPALPHNIAFCVTLFLLWLTALCVAMTTIMNVSISMLLPRFCSVLCSTYPFVCSNASLSCMSLSLVVSVLSLCLSSSQTRFPCHAVPFPKHAAAITRFPVLTCGEVGHCAEPCLPCCQSAWAV